MSKINAVIARNLQFLRNEQDLTYEYIAKVANMGKSTVEEIEKNKKSRGINPDFIKGIAKALSITPDVLTETNAEINELFVRLRDLLERKDYSDTAFELSKDLVMRTSIRGPRERAEALLYAGVLRYVTGKYADATDFYKKAYETVIAAWDEELIHRIRHNLISGYVQTGAYDMACELASKDLAETSNHEYRARDFFLLGMVYRKRKNYEEAEIFLRSALSEIEKDAGNPSFEAKCFQILGSMYFEKHRLEMALESSTVAIQKASLSNDVLTTVYASRTIGRAYLEQGELEKAATEFSCALELLEKNKHIHAVETLKTQYYFFACRNDYFSRKKTLLEIEKHEIPSRELAIMYDETGDAAKELNEFADVDIWRKKAIRVLLN